MLENEEITNTEETTETVETATEDTTPEVIPDEVVEETNDETAAETVDTEEETAKVAEPVTFDHTAEDFEAKATETLEKYDPADIQELTALIDAYKAKAEVPTDTVAEYSVFGTREEVTALLDRQTLLTSQREASPGIYRPNTDKFVEGLPDEVKDYLHLDLANEPSTKYKNANITRAEELLYDLLAIDGDTVGTVKKRINDVVALVKGNAILPPSDIPSFIPKNLIPAFKSLDKEERDVIAQYVPENDNPDSTDAQVRQSKLNMLAKIQTGIDGEARDAQQASIDAQRNEQAFNRDVENIRDTFTNQFRDQFTQNLIKEVKFSDDPARQNFEAKKLVAFLELGFAQDATGKFAREALKDAGIAFNEQKATELLKSVEKAAVDLTTAKNQVDPQGRLLNPVAFNKAKEQFETLTRDFQKFAKDILDQQVKVTTEGKADDIKKEVAKIKVAPKARGAARMASPSPLKKGNEMPSNIVMFSPEYYNWVAEQDMAAMARKAQAYQ